MKNKLTEVPKSDVYEPGVQVKKAIKPGVASSEKIVDNIVK